MAYRQQCHSKDTMSSINELPAEMLVDILGRLCLWERSDPATQGHILHLLAPSPGHLVAGLQQRLISMHAQTLTSG